MNCNATIPLFHLHSSHSVVFSTTASNREALGRTEENMRTTKHISSSGGTTDSSEHACEASRPSNPAAADTRLPKKLQPWSPLKVGHRVTLRRYKRGRTGTIVEALDSRGHTGLAMYAVRLDYAPDDGKHQITCDMLRYELTRVKGGRHAD